MPLVSMKEMMIKGKQEGYAIGQFNLNNLEFTSHSSSCTGREFSGNLRSFRRSSTLHGWIHDSC